MRPQLLEKLKEGARIALISDAGTPLISDPGYKLVRACQDEGVPLTTIPGPSSVLAALVLSGQPTNQFFFAGFVDDRQFAELSSLNSTLIFFESAQRLVDSLQKMMQALPGRSVSVVREITKLYEEVQRGDYAQVIDYYINHPPKGEIVIVIGPPEKQNVQTDELIHALQEALKTHRLKDAANLVAGAYGRPKKEIYQLALSLVTYDGNQ
jgi:16S rRNA (cytidine1402-2'-O)-methyltransferase